MLQDRFIYLTTRKLTQEITATETRELEEMLDQPHFRQVFDWMQQYWEQKEDQPAPDLEAALQKTLALINEEEPEEWQPEEISPIQKPRRSRLRRVLAVATILLIVAGSGLYFLNREMGQEIAAGFNGKKLLQHVVADNDIFEKHNNKGTRSLITLADGSTVWLNADSKLTYPRAFSGNTREVVLTGEAFFDIVKNANRPFIIHLSKGSVRVYGTSFNVKAYDGEETIETSVVTGKVAFIPDNGASSQQKDTTFITPDLKAIFSVDKGITTTVPTIAREDKEWTEGKLLFKNVTLQEIADILNRQFGKEVVFSDESMPAYRLTGSFTNNSLEEILYYLSRSKPFTYRITETQILLTPIKPIE